jgi:transcriptional regulator with GAF, ATPase, and Fis domain
MLRSFYRAIQKRDGLFLHSHGGTIFLDEIGDMPLPFQAKLLRAIEEHEIRPVAPTMWYRWTYGL